MITVNGYGIVREVSVNVHLALEQRWCGVSNVECPLSKG